MSEKEERKKQREGKEQKQKKMKTKNENFHYSQSLVDCGNLSERSQGPQRHRPRGGGDGRGRPPRGVRGPASLEHLCLFPFAFRDRRHRSAPPAPVGDRQGAEQGYQRGAGAHVGQGQRRRGRPRGGHRVWEGGGVGGRNRLALVLAPSADADDAGAGRGRRRCPKHDCEVPRGLRRGRGLVVGARGQRGHQGVQNDGRRKRMRRRVRPSGGGRGGGARGAGDSRGGEGGAASPALRAQEQQPGRRDASCFFLGGGEQKSEKREWRRERGGKE